MNLLNYLKNILFNILDYIGVVLFVALIITVIGLIFFLSFVHFNVIL